MKRKNIIYKNRYQSIFLFGLNATYKCNIKYTINLIYVLYSYVYTKIKNLETLCFTIKIDVHKRKIIFKQMLLQ